LFRWNCNIFINIRAKKPLKISPRGWDIHDDVTVFSLVLSVRHHYFISSHLQHHLSSCWNNGHKEYWGVQSLLVEYNDHRCKCIIIIDTKRMVDTSFEVYVVVLCTIFCRHWLGCSSRHEDLSDMVCQSEIEPLFVDWFLSSKIFHVYRAPWTTRLLWRSSGYNTLWCFQYCTDCRDSIIVVPSLMLYDTPLVTRWLRSKKI
jgi:hypothetical protein